MPSSLTENTSRLLTKEHFQQLAEVPPELEWFANINSDKTRKAYQNDIKAFTQFTGIEHPEEFRIVTRAHVIAWRQTLAQQNLADATIRRKLSALSSLFEYLCESNAVTHNPVKGVKRPPANNNEGKTPAISNEQARKLLEAPLEDTLKGKRDRTILATLLYHGLRRQELCDLKVKDYQRRSGIMMFHVIGKRKKERYIPVEPKTQRLLDEYFDASGHRNELDNALFRPVRNNSRSHNGISEGLNKHIIHALFTVKWFNAMPNKVGLLLIRMDFVSIHYAQRQPLMHWKTKRILRKYRNGWGIPIYPLPDFMISAIANLRIVLALKWIIEMNPVNYSV